MNKLKISKTQLTNLEAKISFLDKSFLHHFIIKFCRKNSKFTTSEKLGLWQIMWVWTPFSIRNNNRNSNLGWNAALVDYNLRFQIFWQKQVLMILRLRQFWVMHSSRNICRQKHKIAKNATKNGVISHSKCCQNTVLNCSRNFK